MEAIDLYQDIVLDHSRHPRNFGKLSTVATHEASGHNPLCGDMVTVHLMVQDDIVADIRFEGSGCAISTASASLMSEVIRGKNLQTVRTLFNDFKDRATGHTPAMPEGLGDEIERLEPLTGVSAYPMRVKCAVLPWHTLVAALAKPVASAKD